MPSVSAHHACRFGSVRARCLIAALLLGIAPFAARAAAVVGPPPPNPLPDDLHYLATSGGLENPEVIFAFNPQPDPPRDHTMVDFSNPEAPSLLLPAVRGSYELVIGFPNGGFTFQNVANGPSTSNLGTTFSFNADAADGSMYQVNLTLGGFEGGWASFNPQPDPPGDIGFSFTADPMATLQIFQIDGGDMLPLSFSPVPEPASLTMLGIGILGLAGRRRLGASRRRAGYTRPRKD